MLSRNVYPGAESFEEPQVSSKLGRESGFGINDRIAHLEHHLTV